MVGRGVACAFCGASAAAWLVVSEEGVRVASASSDEMMPGEELRAGLRYAARAVWPAD